jgi:hypothetical protein
MKFKVSKDDENYELIKKMKKENKKIARVEKRRKKVRRDRINQE